GSLTNGFVDGKGATACFSVVTGLCVDAVGNIYATDCLNNAIRKITRVPSLRMGLSNQQVTLAWPSSAGGFVLETSTNVASNSVWKPLMTNSAASVSNSSIFITNV